MTTTQTSNYCQGLESDLAPLADPLPVNHQ